MILERALGTFLASKIPDLAIFKDDLAWEVAPSFPYVIISQTGKSRKNLGAGACDFRDDSVESKIFRTDVIIRFTFRTLADENMSGNASVAALIAQTDQIFQKLTLQGGVTINDPVTDRDIRIAVSEFASETDVSSLTDKLPIVYQQSLSYRFVVIENFETELQAGVIDRIVQRV